MSSSSYIKFYYYYIRNGLLVVVSSLYLVYEGELPFRIGVLFLNIVGKLNFLDRVVENEFFILLSIYPLFLFDNSGDLLSDLLSSPSLELPLENIVPELSIFLPETGVVYLEWLCYV